MNLFDDIINRIMLETAKFNGKSFGFCKDNKAKVLDRNELILLKDCAFELGGEDLPCVSASLLTDDIHIENGIVLIGNDLKDLKSASPFAKIVLIEISAQSADEQVFYDIIKEADYQKFKMPIEGFMSRASAFNNREQVRVAKSAVKSGLSFEKVGNALIDEYLKLPFVKNVKVIFITDEKFDFDTLDKYVSKSKEITKALNHIFDNLLMDCNHCNLKQICDEVEGMKELHINSIKKQKQH